VAASFARSSYSDLDQKLAELPPDSMPMKALGAADRLMASGPSPNVVRKTCMEAACLVSTICMLMCAFRDPDVAVGGLLLSSIGHGLAASIYLRSARPSQGRPRPRSGSGCKTASATSRGL